MRGFYSTDGMDPHGETKTVEYIPPVPRWGVIRLGIEPNQCSTTTYRRFAAASISGQKDQ